MKKYYHFVLNMTTMNILSIILFIIPITILILFNYDLSFKYLGLVFIIMIPYLILHELIHALGYSLFVKDKNNIRIGISLEKGVLYAACLEPISKVGILISIILPLIVLSIITFPIGLVFNLNWLVFYSIMNFAGAIGDILMFILILKCPKDIEYVDFDNSVGLNLLSKNDLSNIKSLGFKYTSSGEYNESKIDKTLKKFYISRPSIYILIGYILLGIISTVLEIL
jgi:hypothetical protein